MSKCVLQPWVMKLSFMQQSVLLTAVRGADGIEKHHPIKPIIRYYRRCLLISAFDNRAITDPHASGGGSFTGPLPSDMTLETAAKAYYNSVDTLPLHYHMHFLHSVQIMGYKHSVLPVRRFWNTVYLTLVKQFHLFPETEEDMDLRLSDNVEAWKARDIEQS